MRDPIWRLIEARLRRCLPPAHASSTLGDLAEDFARRKTSAGTIRAHLWLLAEAQSLSAAYRATVHPSTDRSGGGQALVDDLRHAARRLATRPAGAGLCTVLLAAGIGLSTAMFSVVDSLLLHPTPFAAADRLVQQTLFRPEPDVMDAWRSSSLFEMVEAARLQNFNFTVGEAGEFHGAFVTPGVFEMLGVRPRRGRLFGTMDSHPGMDDVVVLSESVWRTAFGADPDLIGRRVRLDDANLVVIGIVPASLRFPAPSTVAWRPYHLATAGDVPTTIFGRLTPGTFLEAARAQATAIAQRLAYLPPNWGDMPALRLIGVDGPDEFTRRALWLLFSGVALVFIALCGNVCSLLLTHLSSRQREFATCAALGAARARLVRQAAFEHAAIGVVGAAAGVGLAALLIQWIPDLFHGRTLNVIDIDLRALGMASGLGLLSVLAAGLTPAWLGTRAAPLDSLRGSRQGGEAGAAPAHWLTRGLLTAQLALACALLIGSAILVRSFIQLAHTDRGLNLDGLVLIDVGELDNAFARGPAMALGTAAVEAQVKTWPEVAAVGMSREIPPSWADARVRTDVSIPLASALAADRYRVNDAFFDLYGIRVVRGRRFTPDEPAESVIVSERMAALLWPGRDPLQQIVEMGRTPGRVIGVAREITLPTLEADLNRPEFYVPMTGDSRTLYLSLRCRAECPPAHVARARLADVHPAITARVRPPIEREFLRHLQLPRAIAEIGGVFAVVAVVTAGGGLFSVMTAAVARRRREFGIRVALGASPAQTRRTVVADTLRLASVGIIAGAAGGWIVAQSLASFHYGVTAADPLSWMAVLATLALASAAAAWRPAVQAARVDPVKLLREE